MKIRSLHLAVPIFAVAALPLAAHAENGAVYPTEAAAQAACGSEEVVWVNLDRSKYYHKLQADYGKLTGVYSCAKSARAHGYREAKDAS
jgi:hypothetical protein